MDLYVFTFHHDKQLFRALSPLTPEEVEAHGLPSEGVLGQISALLPSMTPDQFEDNADFVALVHDFVARLGPGLDELQAEARAQGTGEVYVVDGRAGEVTGRVEPVDVIGRFAVRRGEILPDSYVPNDNYRLLTDNGPPQLPAGIEEALLARIRDIARASGL